MKKLIIRIYRAVDLVVWKVTHQGGYRFRQKNKRERDELTEADIQRLRSGKLEW